jgi:phosphonatase-like hydrolase
LEKLIAEQRPTLSAEERSRFAHSAFDRFSSTLTDRLRETRDLAIPQALPALMRLKGAGILVTLNSGFDRKILDVIFSSVPWPRDLFDAVVCGDDVPEGRPAPFMIFRAMQETAVSDATRVAVVGDTRLDLEAGVNAGAAYRIGVLTGAHDRATLERAPHTHIVESVGSVPGLWLKD